MKRSTAVACIALSYLAACAGGATQMEVGADPAATGGSASEASGGTAELDAIAPPLAPTNIEVKAATAQDANLPTAQLVDIDGYLADPTVRVNFSAASRTAACTPAVNDLKWQLPRTMAAAAKAAVSGIKTGGVGVLLGGGKTAIVAAAASAGVSLMGSLVSQLPGLLTSLKDVASCAKGTGSPKSTLSAAVTATGPEVPAFDASSAQCLIVRLGGHTITNCPVN